LRRCAETRIPDPLDRGGGGLSDGVIFVLVEQANLG
jgi:hypothetical protein